MSNEKAFTASSFLSAAARLDCCPPGINIRVPIAKTIMAAKAPRIIQFATRDPVLRVSVGFDSTFEVSVSEICLALAFTRSTAAESIGSETTAQTAGSISENGLFVLSLVITLLPRLKP